jgi:hypothetical protein
MREREIVRISPVPFAISIGLFWAVLTFTATFYDICYEIFLKNTPYHLSSHDLVFGMFNIFLADPVYNFFGAFLIGLFFAGIYNIFASKIKGVTFTLGKNGLERISPLPFAFAIGLIFTLHSFIGQIIDYLFNILKGYSSVNLGQILVSPAVNSFYAASFWFVVIFIFAVVYNLIASRKKGLSIDIN